MRLIDLSHLIEAGSPVYPGDSPPSFKRVCTVDLDGYALDEITTSMHVGTHMDAPAHMIADGRLMSAIPADRCVGRGVLVDARGHRSIGPELLTTVTLERGDIVLVLTGHGDRYGDPSYFTDYPTVSEPFAARLVDAGASALGLDTPSPDRAPHAIHRQLLGSGVLIIENLAGLERLLQVSAFEVWALPVKLAADAAPVRVVARVVG